MADEWIQSVSIGSFSKSSGKNAGYADFTADKITLSKGASVSFTLTPGFTSTQYNEYWKIWIDYNKDGDFDDAGELVYDAGAVSTSARTGSFTVPSGATTQETRLRVSMKYNGAQTACETFSYGEVEDYTANIVDAAPVTCNAPASVSASSVSSSSFLMSWPAATGAVSYQVEYKTSAASTWTTATTSATSYSVTGLSASTTYNYRVKTNCASGSSAYTATQSVSTSAAPPPPASYCASKGNSVSDEWIKSVAIGSINNTSNANAGYGNFTSMSTNLEIGEGTGIVLSPGFKTNILGQATTYPEYWRVWVDLNGDGDFTDAGELAFDAGGTSTTTVNGSVFIPAGTSPKSTRMRVQMKYNGAPTSCETFAYGEVEDYTVNLVDTRASQLASSSQAENGFLELYPNPVKDQFRVEAQMGRANTAFDWLILDQLGRILKQGKVSSSADGALSLDLNIEELKSGLYLLQIAEGGKFVSTHRVVKE